MHFLKTLRFIQEHPEWRTAHSEDVIEKWVSTCTVRTGDGVIFHLLDDIRGKTTEGEKESIKKRLAALAEGMDALYSKEQHFHFNLWFVKLAGSSEFIAGELEVKSGWGKELFLKDAENHFKLERWERNLFIKACSTDRNLYEHYCVGISHVTWNDGVPFHTKPFDVPDIHPYASTKIELLLDGEAEEGKDKYVKVEMREGDGDVRVSAIASIDCKEKKGKEYKKFLKAVNKEAKHMTDRDLRYFKGEYNQFVEKQENLHK